MKTQITGLVLGLGLLVQPLALFADGTAFTYQGVLMDGNALANGVYDLQFTIYANPAGGAALATPNESNEMGVSNGLFTATLDFGCGQFTGNDRWIEVAVRLSAGSDPFMPLSPRQQVLPSPYAIHASSVNAAGIVGTIPAANLGALSSANLAAGSVGTTQIAADSVGTTQIVGGSITVQSLATNIGVWDKSGTTVTYGGGNVGIGTADPSTTLEVNGTVKALAFAGDGSGLTNLQTVTVGIPVNPMQAALLKWYVGNKTFSVGAGPAGVAFDGQNIWVVNGSENTVTKMRASDGGVVGTYAVGANPLAVAFDGSSIWVANQTDNTVTKLRASDGSYFNGTIENSTFAVDYAPNSIAFDGANIWVVCAGNDGGSVTKLRASDGTYANGTIYNSTFALTGSSPSGIAFDGVNVWVSASYIWSGTSMYDGVIKLRATDGGILGNYRAGTGASGIAFDGANIWVANFCDGTVTKLLASDGSTIGTYSVGAGPSRAAFDGTHIWIVNSLDNTVTELLARDGSYVNGTLASSTYAVGSNPRGIAFDGANIWVTNGDDNTVTKL